MSTWGTFVAVLSISIFFSEPGFALGERMLFTRRVEQLTGKPGNLAGIIGQDTPVTFSWRGQNCIIFGDTLLDRNRFFHPNSMGCTPDKDASDGLDLVYFKNNKHQPVLPRVTGEFSVWFDGVYVLNDVAYGHYVRVISADPLVIGVEGIAVMTDFNKGFEYTDATLNPDSPLYGKLGGPAVVHSDGYIYKYVRAGAYLHAWSQVSRVRVENHLNFSAYEFLGNNGWSSDPNTVSFTFENANAPSMYYNNYLKKWIGVSSTIYSAGFVSGIQIFVGNSPYGPFAPGKTLIDQAGHWNVDGEIFQTYNAKHEAAFDRENGRVIYSFATRQHGYNTHLFETQIDYVKSKFTVNQVTDDLEETLRTNKGSEIALRLTGFSYVGATEAHGAKLVIPLKTKSGVARSIRLKIDLGKVNEPTFLPMMGASVIKHYIGTLPRVASTQVDVFVPANSNQIVISGPSLDLLVKSIFTQSTWDKYGEKNFVPLFISRLDNLGWSPEIGEFENGNAPSLEYCHGICPTSN